jgi:hypothetical protein
VRELARHAQHLAAPDEAQLLADAAKHTCRELETKYRRERNEPVTTRHIFDLDEADQAAWEQALLLVQKVDPTRGPEKALGGLPPTIRVFASFSPTDAKDPETWIPVVRQATHPSMPHCPPPPQCDPTDEILVAPLQPGIADVGLVFLERSPEGIEPASLAEPGTLDRSEGAQTTIVGYGAPTPRDRDAPFDAATWDGKRRVRTSIVRRVVDDTGALSPFDLRAKARRLKQKDPTLGLLVVDYLQLMNLKGKVESRQVEVSEISRNLKTLSKELDLPIIALSQLNRKVEERKGGKPMLSDLRESGSIEQDADVVMFIHREDEGEGAPDGEEAARSKTVIPVELIIAKQRNGPVGSIELVFLSEFTRFESRARGEFQ